MCKIWSVFMTFSAAINGASKDPNSGPLLDDLVERLISAASHPHQ